MRSYRAQGLDRQPEIKQMPSQWRAHAERIAEARQELAQVIPNPRAEVIYLDARRASRDRELAETRAVIERVATRLDEHPVYEPGEGDWLRQQPTASLQEARSALAEARSFEKHLDARDEREKRAQLAPAPARKVDTPAPAQKGEGVALGSLLAQGQRVTLPPPPVAPPGRDQVIAEAVERARVEHRETDRQVVHARRVLESAEREREQAAQALARGLPEAESTATKAKGQEAGHAAQAARLEREADTWLAQHRIRASIGSTGPADELRAKAKYHAEQARTWGEAAKAAEQTAGRLRHGDSEAARALTLAQHSLAGARARADRQFEQMGVYAETIKAGRAYDAQHPPSPRERLLAGMERIEKQQWHEYQRDGERYRRDTPEADKALRVQWLHDGTGQWHEQPRETVLEHARGQGRDPDPPRHRPRGMGGR